MSRTIDSIHHKAGKCHEFGYHHILLFLPVSDSMLVNDYVDLP